MANMEERVQRISQMAALGELAGQVAHEVRNPPGIIKGATEMLAKRVSDPAMQRRNAVLPEGVRHRDKAVESLRRHAAPLRSQANPVDLQHVLRAVGQA